MLIRFDVEAYGHHAISHTPFTEAEYAANQVRWKGYAETLLAYAAKRGAWTDLDTVPYTSNGQQFVAYNATARMMAGQFHRMLLDLAPTPFGVLIRSGLSIAASMQEGYEGTYAAQALLIDPIIPYLAHVYIDSEYWGYDPQEGVMA